MWDVAGDIVLIIGSYLLGSFPYMLLRSRARGLKVTPGEDYHIAMWHKMDHREGVIGIGVDALKGVIPIAAGFIFDFGLAIIAIAGVAAVIGQMWPVFQKFNGEKGNTTGAGMIVTF